MIVRPDGDSWLLVTQPDHAALAADLLAAWHADGLPERPSRQVLLNATRAHDCGWQVEDDAPSVDPDTGTPWDFIHLPAARRQAVWPRAMTLLADSPHEAALVAHHAVTIYARYDGDAAWRDFFRTMSAERDARVAALAADAGPVTFDSFLRDYASLRTADLLSLTLCHGWQDRFELDYYRGEVSGSHLVLSPDPFAGQSLAWTVPARRIARQPYRHDDELREACANAPRELLTGRVSGRPEPLPS